MLCPSKKNVALGALSIAIITCGQLALLRALIKFIYALVYIYYGNTIKNTQIYSLELSELQVSIVYLVPAIAIYILSLMASHYCNNMIWNDYDLIQTHYKLMEDVERGVDAVAPAEVGGDVAALMTGAVAYDAPGSLDVLSNLHGNSLGQESNLGRHQFPEGENHSSAAYGRVRLGASLRRGQHQADDRVDFTFKLLR